MSNQSGDNYLLRVENLKTHFFSREGTLRAVDGVDFQIHKGETLGIVGESGCGKSVTSQSIMRIVPNNGRIVDGRIMLNTGDNIKDLARFDSESKELRNVRGKEIAMIFQEPMSSFCPVYTIGNQITEVIRLHQKESKTRAEEIAVELLKKVGLPQPDQIIAAYPFNLSGGMRQRAMIAMALSCQPKLLMADEPTTALDVTIQAQVLELIGNLQKDLQMGLLLITHDLGVIAELADRVVVMYLGKRVEYAGVEELFYNPKHPYTKALLASVPQMGKGSQQVIETISGSVPSLYEMPSGCRFHPRCPDSVPGICDSREPPCIEVSPGHDVSCFLYAERIDGDE